MRWPNRSAAFMIAFLVVGCGGDDATAPPIGSIVGAWTATMYQYTSVPPGTTYDVVAYGGIATLEFQQDGDFVLVVSPPGVLSTTTYGFWELNQDMMSLTPQGMPFAWEFDAALINGALSLRGAAVEYDFDGDYAPDSATLDMLLVK